MNGLYSNRATARDFVKNALARHGRNCDVLIASAFFSNSDAVSDLLGAGCRVQLIVRLGPGTSAEHLRKLLGRTGVSVRYFTDPSFHPKLYVFGSSAALVGSANLTSSGMMTNQEIAITVVSDDPRFDELANIFQDYWEEAKVLTEEDLRVFKQVESEHSSKGDHDLEQAVLKRLGRHAFSNIARGIPKASESEQYIDSYRRRYQTFRDAFAVVNRVYAGVGRRLVDPSVLPLRIEIDQFFSFIRELHAPGDSFLTAPLLTGPAQEDKIREFVEKYLDHGWDHLTETVAKRNYPLLQSTLGSPAALQAVSADQLYDALFCVHAFHDRFRFFDGGKPTMRLEFLRDNSLPRLKKTLGYLLHTSRPDHVVRMAHCIFGHEYRLDHFGEACVQETYGWVNSDEVPICNGRTLKGLRFLGFNVQAT